jgi:predicted ferric reductase
VIANVTTSPALWYVNRGTGMVLMALLTATLLLGMMSAGQRSGRLVPVFLPQYLHRYLSALALLLLLTHVGSAVADQYVEIRWFDAVVPLTASYQRAWMALGALALDLLAAVVVTSLLRGRTSARLWRTVHLTAYLAWVAALAHGVGIGTDRAEPWAQRTAWACVVLVATAVLVRGLLLLVTGRRPRTGDTVDTHVVARP